MTYSVFVLSGTGFPQGGDGICERFAAHLDERFFVQYIRYPAEGFGRGMAWADSREFGKQALLKAIRDTDNIAVPVGYSQGADIVGDVVAEIGDGKHPGLEVAGCALIADPRRPEGATMPGIRPASGYGVAGARPIRNIPTWWAAVEGDAITSLPAGSPLRTASDVMDYFSLSSPEAALAWGVKLYAKALEKSLQPWWKFENRKGWAGAARDIWGYLPPPIGGGLHTYRYVQMGLLPRLAEAVNRGVR